MLIYGGNNESEGVSSLHKSLLVTIISGMEETSLSTLVIGRIFERVRGVKFRN